MRMCIVCRQRREKKEFIRLVKDADGQIHVDATGKEQARGAYLCRERKCLELARKKHALERTFSRRIDDSVYERLFKEAGELSEQQG